MVKLVCRQTATNNTTTAAAVQQHLVTDKSIMIGFPGNWNRLHLSGS